MNRLVVLAILIALAAPFTLAAGALPPELQALNREIGIQAASLQDSPEHQQAKERDTRHYQIGDTNTFWRWNLAVMPPTWMQTIATCRAVGEHCYIFVANDQWNVHMNQADVDSALVRLEDRTINDPTQGAIEMDISLFGNIPDALDNDPKLIVFYSALGSFQGTSFDGYFSAYNQVTEAQAQQMNPPGHSNECEMIYMTCYPLNPVAPIRLSVLAHELEHLIHWGADANEESWLDEGCAELAMVAYGIPDPISGFNANPDNSLTSWNQLYADYVKVMLFFTYLQEHYDATGMIRNLVADPQNGITALTAQLAVHYPQSTVGTILRDWTIANMLDSPMPGAGIYGYQALDLPNFFRTNLNLHPAQNGLGIQPYAADYLEYDLSSSPGSITITANPPLHISTLIMNQAGQCTAVLDGGITSALSYSPIPSEAYHAIFVLSNQNSTPVSYSYSSAPVANFDPYIPEPVAKLSCYPNPFSGSCQIKISGSGNYQSEIEIYNQRGQKLIAWDRSAADEQNFSWDGRDAQGKMQPSGVYFCRYSSPHGTLTRKILKLK